MDCIDKAYSDGHIAQATHANYRVRMAWLMKHTTLSDIDVVLNTVASMAVIKQQTAGGSQLVFIKMIKAVFKHHLTLRCNHPQVYDIWQTFYTKVNAPVQHRVDWHIPTQAQADAYMPWRKVLEARDRLNVNSMEYLVLALYTMVPPVRADYGNVKILRQEPSTEEELASGNYLVVRPGYIRLTLNAFKTKTAEKPRFLKLFPLDLMDVVHSSLLKHPRDYLIVSPRTGKPYINDNAYIQYVNKIISTATKPGMGITMLRHIFIDSIDFNSTRCGALKMIADDMMHSTTTQLLYRMKFETPVMRG